MINIKNEVIKKQENFWNNCIFHPTDAIEDSWGKRILDRFADDKTMNMNKNSRGSLALGGLVKLLLGVVLMALLLFVPAGNWAWSGGWRLLAVLFVPMFLMGVVMLIFSPDLLARRLNAKEKRSAQSSVVRLSGLVFVAGFVVAGLDARYGWSEVSGVGVAVAVVLFLLSYVLYAEVLRENVWLSRTIEVSDGQSVVSTGLYGVVRHPMYFATLLMFLSMPLVLGSWWSFAVLLLYIPIIVTRTLDEERLLRKELNGYEEYCTKVRWRILPFIW